MRKPAISTARVPLPSFGRASACPAIPVDLYKARLERTRQRLSEEKLDLILIYADREHSATIAYLTGFEPRFEEALLLLSAAGERKLLVGNECMGYLPDARALDLEVELFQEFSLLGQPRGDSRSLRTILRDFGVRPDCKVGCVGWKYFEGKLLTGGKHALDVPAYLADLVRELTKDPKQVTNATALFMHVQDGLRVINEPAQIACYEHAAGITSDGVLNVMRHLEPGVAEDRLEKHLETRGLPLSCHRMISFGEKAKRGLASPSGKRAQLGDTYTIGFGVQGALSCRAGAVAATQRDLPIALRDFYPKFAANYFAVVAAWYETLSVGVEAGAVFNAVERVRDRELYRFAVNPGHYLHLDEWLHSPFVIGSAVQLRSGMMLQMDIIPVSLGPFCYINAEDGVVLADAALAADLSREYPAMWERIQARRRFMTDKLGIRLDPCVLPLSNTPGWLPPMALRLDSVLVKEKGR
jgi:hypothetical protein